MISKTNKVYLVGAGPGDPLLLTLKAKQLLQQAEVVLYDYLVHQNILNNAPKTAELICVGKRKGYHSKKQEEINALILEYHQKGKSIIRLKGGDPFVFGRVGEEMTFFNQHNIPFEVVPGITSAIAVPEYAGVPLTHRNLSRSVAFVTGTLNTGEQIEDKNLPQADTLVFLMAITHLERLAQKLTTHKPFNPNTPATLIHKGTTADQKVVTGTLSTIAELQETHQILPPSILVVGEVAKFTKEFNWFEDLPLFGKRCWVLRRQEQAEELTNKLTQLGAEVLQVPTIKIDPQKETQATLNKEALNPIDIIIFTSTNGVQQFFKAINDNNSDSRILANKTLIAIGPKTNQELKHNGIIADIVPKQSSSKGLLNDLKERIDANKLDLTNKTILIPTSKQSHNLLAPELKSMGADVNLVALYNTLAADIPDELEAKDGDHVFFTSSSTATHFFNSSCYTSQAIISHCIGPVTEKTVKQHTSGEIRVATQETIEGLLETLIETK